MVASPVSQVWTYDAPTARTTVAPSRGTEWTWIGLVAVGGALLLYGWEFSIRRRVWPLSLALTLLGILAFAGWWWMNHPGT